MKLLYTAVAAMLLQQSFGSISNLVVPMTAPVMVETLGLNPALVGAYSLFTYGMGVLATLLCGSFIIRYGGLRVSQVAVLASSAGLLIAITGELWLMAVGAMMIGAGLMVSTPSSSHILARHSPPKVAPLMFSIKQTGVPVGLMAGGLIIPFFIYSGGWQAAFIGVSLIGVIIAVALQPLRRRFDDDRNPTHPFKIDEVWFNLRAVLSHRYLRKLAFASLTFVGLQGCFVSFFVLFLVQELRFDLKTAGIVFSIAQIAALFARIFWGWLGSRYLSPPHVLAFLGFAMSLSAVILTFANPNWSVAIVTVIASIVTGTALSWHGVLFAEIARHSPPGKVGPYTGSVLAFTAAGQMTIPALFGVSLATFENYQYGFYFAAFLTLTAGILLLYRQNTEPSSGHGF
ncbi:MAG: MFS transporter [Gammaproteobacteria bacterium]|nr:MFS transporter [Gammaproteobacteria bacterium]